ncbi:MAG: endonuclease/exonuclease/phosphatase family protein [Burkholderiaceae bacterium]
MLVVSGGVTLLLVAITALPVSNSNQWWVRVWDYPRPQVLVAAALALSALVAGTLITRKLSKATYLMSLALSSVMAVQLAKIIPYTPVWPLEVDPVAADESHACIKILTSNVKMENRQSAALRDMIEREKPDVALILENDQWWSDQLAQVTKSYPHVLDQPQDNTYGLLFLTTLDPGLLEIRHLSDPAIPSVRATLSLESGERIVFYGVHPTPPRIGQDTDLRDHELILVAQDIRSDDRPSIVSGDLNDVAWSKTTNQFKRIAQVLDPRIGRGLFATFTRTIGSFGGRWTMSFIPRFRVAQSSRARVDRLRSLSPGVRVVPDPGRCHRERRAGRGSAPDVRQVRQANKPAGPESAGPK